MSDHISRYLAATADIVRGLPVDRLDAMAARLATVRDGGGRLFILGVGGGAAHASHAVNDFRKLCAIEAYAPTDNVAELTARTNDEGWEATFAAWLATSRMARGDALLVFSVGGGSREHNVSMNLVRAMEYAQEQGTEIFAVVGRSDGEAAQMADVAVVVEAPPDLRTPIVEALQAVAWHGLVSHPGLAVQPGKWESLQGVGP